MVIIRSLEGIKPEQILSVVVFPEPVPPEIKTFKRPLTMACSKSAMGLFRLP